MTGVPLGRRVLAEFVGTVFLLAAIVGSGAMAERLTDDVGLQLLQNAIATAGALVALILAFAPVSGAHFNPAVTLAERLLGGIDNRTAAAYIPAQVGGAVTGVITANLMFDLSPVVMSTKSRSGSNLVLAESVATLGLLLVIFGVARLQKGPVAAYAVAGYIAAAFAFTSSTSFANPAVSIARTLSDTFAGIEPSSVPPFIAAQLVATGVAVALVRILFPAPAPTRDTSVRSPTPDHAEA